MNKSDNIDQLAVALSKVQSKIKGAVEDSTNPHFKSKYASLQSVIDVAREPLAANGLSVTQLLSDGLPNHVTMETVLLHSSGQWISSTFSVPVTKQDAQGYGSACTYARRYSYMSLIGIAPIDDDANAAVEPAPEERGTKIPANYLKFIETATNADQLLKWSEGIDKKMKENPQFRNAFKKKWDALKEKGVEA